MAKISSLVGFEINFWMAKMNKTSKTMFVSASKLSGFFWFDYIFINIY